MKTGTLTVTISLAWWLRPAIAILGLELRILAFAGILTEERWNGAMADVESLCRRAIRVRPA
jgi:hypothetical protein